MISSVRDFPQGRDVDIAFLDFGLGPADREWLAERGVMRVEPSMHLLSADGVACRPSQVALLVRPFLRENIPGYDVYLWIDADVWLQRWETVETYVTGAFEQGLAISHERTPSYRFQAWLLGWTAKHLLLGFGAARGLYLLSRPHLNAGIFAMRQDAPHWAAWVAHYRAAYDRSGAPAPHDQFSLNEVVHGGPFRRGLPTRILPPHMNWICDRGIPMWNDAAAAFCEPQAPYRVIGALHLAGPAKRTEYAVRRTRGGSFTARLVYGTRPADAAARPAAPGGPAGGVGTA
jgi:hypothetical protein